MSPGEWSSRSLFFDLLCFVQVMSKQVVLKQLTYLAENHHHAAAYVRVNRLFD
jgi:hypothetical protein